MQNRTDRTRVPREAPSMLIYQISRAEDGDFPLVKNPQFFVAMDSSDHLSLIESTVKEV